MFTTDLNKKLLIYSSLVGATIVVLAFSFNPDLLNKISLKNIISITNRFKPQEEIQTPKPSVFKDSLKPLYANPTRLFMNSVNVDFDIIEVGVEEDGALEAPDDWNVGGWYYKSAKPGEVGNIIVNAHYDNNFGAPAALYELKNAQINDRVFLVDSLGKVYTYKITNLFYIDILDPERLKIFDKVYDKSELTLITCGGVWIPGEGYNKRLVVKSELVHY